MAQIESNTEINKDTAKNRCDTDADEGFDSPSVQRANRRKEDGEKKLGAASISNSDSNDTDSHSTEYGEGQSLPTVRSDNKPKVSSEKTDSKSNPVDKVDSKSTPVDKVDSISTPVKNLDSVNRKAETVAEFIVLTLVGRKDGKTNDKVEQTMLRCVKRMMEKHEILFRGMMKRLQVTRETGYMTFVAVANEIFEGEKAIVNWGRVIALYAFGGQLALYCKSKSMEDYVQQIAVFMGKYAAEVVTPFVVKAGGWTKLCEEFPPEDDLENKAWKFLTWTAIGLGLAATASFLTSH